MQPHQQMTDDGSRVYARATPRLQALIRDLAVQATILVCLVVPPTVLANQDLLRVLAPVCLLAFVFYEPVLIALRGATLGHSSLNLRIVRARDFGRVSFPRALLRTVVKWIFGLPSFLAMYFTSKHQAIHDLVSGTVVIPREPRWARPEWFDPARPEPAASVLPGRARRAIVILGHWLAWFLMWQIGLAVIVPGDCIEQMRTCPQPVKLLVAVIAGIWLAGTIVLAFAGWKGALWGAQRTRAELPRTLLVLIAVFMPIAASAQDVAGHDAQVDRIFANWTASTPGCAVGVSVAGKPVLARAYGMTDLEHGVANTADTIFESGSVAKQFTAAAVLLLARDGRLSLDDQVRKYIPELPDYGVPLTIRHMLTHTSGLRDWGSVAGIGGAPRGARTYTHAHVLDIVSRQRELNFTPGTRYSYSNTGYNLAAILVSRVSGLSFAEFTRRRIFEPLGMTRSSWRDDYTRIVKDRAIAYAPEGDHFRQSMPFENVYGNGGMLTTVGDLLKWTTNFASPKVGDAAFVRTQIEPGRFSDGRAHGYALGLQVGSYKGVRAISHGGATAGYRTQLSVYPDQDVTVAVLCNAANADAGSAANAVADIYLGKNLKAPAAPSSKYTLTSADYAAALGLFRDTSTGQMYRVIREGDSVRIQPGPGLVPISATQFMTNDGGAKWEVIDGGKAARFSDEYATVTAFEKVPAIEPSAAALQDFTGTYVSTEAETSMIAVIEDGALVLKQRPAVTMKLTPVYADAFTAPGLGLVIFRRDAARRVTAFSLKQDRVWDLRFTREAGAAPTP